MFGRWLGLGCACVLTASVAAAQQAPDAAKPAAAGSVTVEGCVVKEVDAPGREPLETDRANVVSMNNFLLMDTKVVQGDAIPNTPSYVMYKIQGLKKGDLGKQVGKRVQIDGTFDKVGNVKYPLGSIYNLVEVKGKAFRPVEGTCANAKK